MKKILYAVFSKTKIAFLRTGKTKLSELMFTIIEKYYELLSKKRIHQDAVVMIMKDYFVDKEQLQEARKYIFSKKNDTDKIYEDKFGKKGSYMAELNKLIQIIYFKKNTIDLKNYSKTDKIKKRINKDFNKISLFVFEKYQ